MHAKPWNYVSWFKTKISASICFYDLKHKDRTVLTIITWLYAMTHIYCVLPIYLMCRIIRYNIIHVSLVSQVLADKYTDVHI